METKAIDKEIKRLESLKHKNKIKASMKTNTYDDLFFTYGNYYSKVVHFATFACDNCNIRSYAILCKGGEWRHDGYNDEGHHLDLIRLMNNDAIFMTWDEMKDNLCPECLKYMTFEQVVENYINRKASESFKRLEKLMKAGEILNKSLAKLKTK